MVEGLRRLLFVDSPVPMIYFGGEPSPPAKPKVMQKLRERGIYALSDGREFVVHAVFRGGYVFYTPEDWQIFGPHAYEANSGRTTALERPTRSMAHRRFDRY